ncbi:hypothetical protein [uncultured Dokdonia sp.]|uniref:hypothetical protein n=1 Tax=uncultured Dokdonia sp. TaxID=575653 RepID=UPI00260C5187|nr:hypothetical protein [uncultured Dokdonia sp.]
MKNKFDLNLEFLYQLPLVRDYSIGGGFDKELDDWMSKYDKERADFQKFEKRATINDLLYTYIYSFREKTPDLTSLAFTIEETYEKISETKTKYMTSRSDITSFEVKTVLGDNRDEFFPEGRDRFDKELTIFLRQSYTINAIDEALQEIMYEKEMEGDTITYKVQDGVIDTLVVTPDKIIITISDDKLVDYYRTSPRNPG